MVKVSSVLSGLMGVCVGDALGVPVEFSSRAELLKNPVKIMIGHGTYNQPPGTWSDDSSLTFCLAEAITKVGFSEQLLPVAADYFLRWYEKAFWTPYNHVFDIGIATTKAIKRLQQGVNPPDAGGKDERDNGNGSLMRILPLAFGYSCLEFSQLIKLVEQISCITHGHLRSQMACGIYISIAVNLLLGESPQDAYVKGIKNIKSIYQKSPYKSQLSHVVRIIDAQLINLSIDEIKSSGYVIDSLEASLWCFLNSSSYAEAVLKAVNLGEDTDTNAAITGGLAGIYYGYDNIPIEWRKQIVRHDEIIDLANRLQESLTTS